MNFGVKITILYISFVVLILTLVFMCFNKKVELVSKDYYAQELKFQDKINAINNEKGLVNSINHIVNSKTITLSIDSTLMSKDFEGTINFFRPSDSSKDVKIKMNFSNQGQIINCDQFIHGVYKMELSWVSNKINFYKEEIIFIN
ncbi:MAG: FixH family protein [Bacteroidota bacterium]|nr:FixH family protein [Bacteroidota bacterium]MDP3145812.1 FixH family protein [Bacteroidota bacterium]MDP3558446.1 FixH family protein [Bacteroidota bacterium]